jgi:hypothetical protein
VIDTWAPLESSVRIQYERAFVHRLARRQEDDDMTGVLYGTRTRNEVQVRSTKPRADLQPVGVFSARPRGEVFLTEQDLVRLEALDSSSAIGLAIAGCKGGFFVREPDGSMQTIQSYQEFPIDAPAPTMKRSLAPRAWIPVGIAAGVSIVVAMTILAWPASAFTIQPQEGQMRITLHRIARSGAWLEITDGADRSSILITPELTSIVYAPRTSDVHVRLIR